MKRTMLEEMRRATDRLMGEGGGYLDAVSVLGAERRQKDSAAEAEAKARAMEEMAFAEEQARRSGRVALPNASGACSCPKCGAPLRLVLGPQAGRMAKPGFFKRIFQPAMRGASAVLGFEEIMGFEEICGYEEICGALEILGTHPGHPSHPPKMVLPSSPGRCLCRCPNCRALLCLSLSPEAQAEDVLGLFDDAIENAYEDVDDVSILGAGALGRPLPARNTKTTSAPGGKDVLPPRGGKVDKSSASAKKVFGKLAIPSKARSAMATHRPLMKSALKTVLRAVRPVVRKPLPQLPLRRAAVLGAVAAALTGKLTPKQKAAASRFDAAAKKTSASAMRVVEKKKAARRSSKKLVNAIQRQRREVAKVRGRKPKTTVRGDDVLGFSEILGATPEFNGLSDQQVAALIEGMTEEQFNAWINTGMTDEEYDAFAVVFARIIAALEGTGQVDPNAPDAPAPFDPMEGRYPPRGNTPESMAASDKMPVSTMPADAVPYNGEKGLPDGWLGSYSYFYGLDRAGSGRHSYGWGEVGFVHGDLAKKFNGHWLWLKPEGRDPSGETGPTGKHYRSAHLVYEAHPDWLKRLNQESMAQGFGPLIGNPRKDFYSGDFAGIKVDDANNRFWLAYDAPAWATAALNDAAALVQAEKNKVDEENRKVEAAEKQRILDEEAETKRKQDFDNAMAEQQADSDARVADLKTTAEEKTAQLAIDKAQIELDQQARALQLEAERAQLQWMQQNPAAADPQGGYADPGGQGSADPYANLNEYGVPEPPPGATGETPFAIPEDYGAPVPEPAYEESGESAFLPGTMPLDFEDQVISDGTAFLYETGEENL